MAAKHRHCIWGFVLEIYGVCSIHIYIFLKETRIGDLIPGMPESEGFRGNELGEQRRWLGFFTKQGFSCFAGVV